MAGNIMSGLMAGANFGTGFLQGQQTSQNQQFANKINDLAFQDAQLRLDQNKLMTQQQQVLSDKAMQLFSPTTPGAGTAAATPNPPQQPPAANLPGTTTPMGDLSAVGNKNADPVSKIEELANFAAGSGDLVHANQLWTNAANLQTAKFEQQQKQAAIQTAELKRQQLSHAYVAQTLGAAQNADQFNQAKMELLSNPMVTPEESKNLANLNYSPEVVDMIRTTGMNSSQQAANKLREQQFQERQRITAMDEARKDRDQARKDAHEVAWQQHQTAQNKVGAAAKAPSANDLAAATQATKDAMGEDVNVQDPNFLQARQNVAARALQIVRDNRAVTYPQAVTMAAQEAKRNGEFEEVKTPDTRTKIFGMAIPGTGEAEGKATTFKEKGNVPENAIPFTGQAKSELVPGKYYQTSNGLMQWTGTGWMPQS